MRPEHQCDSNAPSKEIAGLRSCKPAKAVSCKPAKAVSCKPAKAVTRCMLAGPLALLEGIGAHLQQLQHALNHGVKDNLRAADVCRQHILLQSRRQEQASGPAEAMCW